MSLFACFVSVCFIDCSQFVAFLLFTYICFCAQHTHMHKLQITRSFYLSACDVLCCVFISRNIHTVQWTHRHKGKEIRTFFYFILILFLNKTLSRSSLFFFFLFLHNVIMFVRITRRNNFSINHFFKYNLHSIVSELRASWNTKIFGRKCSLQCQK